VSSRATAVHCQSAAVLPLFEQRTLIAGGNKKGVLPSQDCPRRDLRFNRFAAEFDEAVEDDNAINGGNQNQSVWPV